MCKELCDASPTGEMQSFQDCGRLICWDVENGDDVVRPAYATISGDLYCDQCGKAQDHREIAEDEEIEDIMADEYGEG